MNRIQGRKEIAEQVIIALLCTVLTEAVVAGVDYLRKRHGLSRAPEGEEKTEKPKGKNRKK